MWGDMLDGTEKEQNKDNSELLNIICIIISCLFDIRRSHSHQYHTKELEKND